MLEYLHKKGIAHRDLKVTPLYNLNALAGEYNDVNIRAFKGD